jgi:hypothetical protein
MSTTYSPLKKVAACELFDGRLQEFGVREHFNKKTNKQERMLTDGNNFLWVFVGDDGFVNYLKRFFPNGAPGKILNAIGEAFDTYIASEHEPQFWGFDTQEEWDAWNEKVAKEDDDEFYADLLNYLNRKPHNIQRGTNGMGWAKAAKKLVKKDPTLLLSENKDKLLKAARGLYDRDHAVIVELTEKDIALAKMLATHEDDLPQA